MLSDVHAVPWALRRGGTRRSLRDPCRARNGCRLLRVSLPCPQGRRDRGAA
ncbi:MAG: hypothetical protein ACK52I_05765 [Pseudomonadota bacterium]